MTSIILAAVLAQSPLPPVVSPVSCPCGRCPSTRASAPDEPRPYAVPAPRDDTPPEPPTPPRKVWVVSEWKLRDADGRWHYHHDREELKRIVREENARLRSIPSEPEPPPLTLSYRQPVTYQVSAPAVAPVSTFAAPPPVLGGYPSSLFGGLGGSSCGPGGCPPRSGLGSLFR